ncbi:polymer-forming cytoskeletal protein [Paenibacillus lemnae]|uniref:Polymer-forming cytoskeletal protein n=1 Tax=Paenibacillus lemnae TaxID=1330551 RepID=A0A848M8T1_PAELE|nr:polymer-forming cytoskeletal protein [Paenibacillus lemnae]NMO96669.1 polymer-forming cytoskeletal protein [Paenibacillus lemnae]
MERESIKRDHLHISGFGKAAGGYYDKVQFDGACSVGGDLDCRKFTANGSVTVNGSLTAEKMTINGTGTIEGPVDALEIQVSGNASIKGEARTRKLEVSGRAHVHGRLSAGEVEITGRLIARELHTGRLKVKGGFKIDERLQADVIKIKLYDRCEAGEIYGSDISVLKKGKKLWEHLSLTFRPIILKARVIEGNNVEISYTEGELVRGGRVWIGPECRIGLVEYKEELVVDPSAVIGETRKI